MIPSLRTFMQSILKNALSEGAIAVDATAGNGYDTLFLAKTLNNTGHVFAFDIQQQALEQTQALLSKNLILNTTLCLQGHENLQKTLLSYNVSSIDAALFNLGYLPRSNKQVITQPKTTLQALSQALNMLKKNAILCVHTYTGHYGGFNEFLHVQNFCLSIPWTLAHTASYSFTNKPSHSETLFIIQKQ